MRNFRRILIILVVTAGVFLLGGTFWLRDRYVVPIITYHHVGKLADESLILNTVSVESFEKQMHFLKKYGYHVISFKDLVDGLKKGRLFQRDTVVIQFDDGYEDNYTNAFPILKEYEFPAMVFLVSDFIGTHKGFLNWAQVKEMEKYHFMAGAHTRLHKYLPNLSEDEIREEVFGSKRVIEDHLSHPIEYFAYPSGGFNVPVKQIVKEAGFEAAVTTNRGKDRFNKDLYELKRIRMNDGDNRFGGVILWAKLSGYYNLLRKSKDGGSVVLPVKSTYVEQ